MCMKEVYVFWLVKTYIKEENLFVLLSRAAFLLTVVIQCTIIDKNQTFLLILRSICVHAKRKTCILLREKQRIKRRGEGISKDQ